MKAAFGADFYGEDYFENGLVTHISNYERYRWLPDRFRVEAGYYLDVGSVQRPSVILDFGCAKGFLVRALVEKGHDAYGYDISPYAIANADPAIRHRCCVVPEGRKLECTQAFDLVIASHVLEHIERNRVQDVISQLHGFARKVIISVPVGESGVYWNPKHGEDVSHLVAEPPHWWVQRVCATGARVERVVSSSSFHRRPDVVTITSV